MANSNILVRSENEEEKIHAELHNNIKNKNWNAHHDSAAVGLGWSAEETARQSTGSSSFTKNHSITIYIMEGIIITQQ